MEKREADITTCPYLILNHLAIEDKMHLSALDKRIRRLQHLLGFTDKHEIRSCHDCRRTYASIQYLHGVDIKTIQKQLGHRTPQQTWDYIKDIVDTETRLNSLSKGCILGA
jgi:integrase